MSAPRWTAPAPAPAAGRFMSGLVPGMAGRAMGARDESRVIVIGGGPEGLAAAALLAGAGSPVTLLEARGTLGGLAGPVEVTRGYRAPGLRHDAGCVRPALLAALVHYVTFRIIGVPFALALALWVGVISQFIPAIGTYLAGVFPLLIALAEDPPDAIWVLVVIVAYQQLENYVLAPRITAHTMDLHPAVAFGSAIVGASLLGVAGALLALPAAATIVALIQTYADHYEVVATEPATDPDEYESRLLEATERRLRSHWRTRRRKAGVDRAAS